MAALAIRIDNNRAKLEGFDYAIAGLSDEMSATRESVITANQEVLAEYNARLEALESVDMQSQIDTLYFISIVALLAGVGALIWGFLGNN
jgi:5-enolpyruvylshikimate-3-phosphate synthase